MSVMTRHAAPVSTGVAIAQMCSTELACTVKKQVHVQIVAVVKCDGALQDSHLLLNCAIYT